MVADENKATILFVDDEKPVLMSLRALLRVKYNVQCAHNSTDALTIIKQGVEVVISDQRMPGVLGTDVLRETKKIAPLAARILLTGYADPAALLEAVNDCEVFRLMRKPWGNEQLTDAIALAVESARGRANKLGVVAANIRTGQFPVAPGQSVAPQGSGRPAVLLLSEDTRLARQVTTGLKGIGDAAPVLHETSIDAALNRLGEQEIAVLLVDINAKREEKLEFLYALKRLHPLVNGVVIARDVGIEDVLKLVNYARIYRYLVLPIEDSVLCHSVRSALQHYGQCRAQPSLLLYQKPDPTPAMRDMTLMQKLLAKATMWRRQYYKAV